LCYKIARHRSCRREARTHTPRKKRCGTTHREPATAEPTTTSLVTTLFPPAAGERDLHALGREVSEHLREGMERAIEERARIGEDRFLDVHHGELVADPKGTVRRVYDWLGLALEPDVAQTIFGWQEANARGAKGTPRYTPEQFGLSVEQIRSDYDFYIRHFDVTVEG